MNVMKDEHMTESFDRELLISPCEKLLSLTPRGFISRNELKFQSHSGEFTPENPDGLNFGRESLDLSKGKYTDFRQKGLFSLLSVSENLIELDLSANKLVFFPIEVVHLTHLRSLRLDHNEIRTISTELDKICSLEFLSISNNLLTNLPNSLSRARNLKVLNIGRNLIADITPVCTVKTLEILYFYGNLLTGLPTALANLTNLRELTIEWLKYAEPGISPIIKRPQNKNIFDKLFTFLASKKAKIVDFFDFLRHFSLGKLDFTQKDAKGRTLIHNAAIFEELGVLSAISLKFPKLLNVADKDFQTPLTLSILEEKFRSSEFLIDLGADCSLGGGIFGSALHLAVSKLNVKIVEKLLPKLNSSNSHNRRISQDFDRNSPFHILFSIFGKDPESAEKIAKKLLAVGLDPNLKNKELFTAMHIAVKKNQLSAVKFAIENNGRKNIEKDNCGEMIMNICPSKSCELPTKKLGALKSLGKIVDSGKIFLHKTPNYGNMNESVDFRQNEKKEAFFALDKKGGNAKWSLAHLASFLGSIEMLHLLDEANVDFFQTNATGQDPLRVSYQSIVVIKTIRKAQKNWIVRNIIKKPAKSADFIENINDSENIIAKNMKKKQQVFRSNGEFLLSKGRRFKKGNEEAEENYDDMEEYSSEENVTQKMLNKSSEIGNISDHEQTVKKKKGKKEGLNQNASEEILSFKKEKFSNLRVFVGESGFQEEIERVYKLMNSETILLFEKMQGLFYFGLIRQKALGLFQSFSSMRLPVNVFLMNEAQIDRKNGIFIANLIEKLFLDEMMNETPKELHSFDSQISKEELKMKHRGVTEEEMNFLRRKNQKQYSFIHRFLLVHKMAANSSLFGLLLKEKMELMNDLKRSKILLYEIIENILVREWSLEKKKGKHSKTKSMNNVSFSLENNFLFVEKKTENKKKKQSISFWGISPEKLENKENFSSKPYFLV